MNFLARVCEAVEDWFFGRTRYDPDDQPSLAPSAPSLIPSPPTLRAEEFSHGEQEIAGQRQQVSLQREAYDALVAHVRDGGPPLSAAHKALLLKYGVVITEQDSRKRAKAFIETYGRPRAWR